LVESIVYQQLAGSAASVIYGRFRKYYGNYPPVYPINIEVILFSKYFFYMSKTTY
jgi:3-methyladenine DNA glycosylase/8-oxoguanine DNA glycosylase